MGMSLGGGRTFAEYEDYGGGGSGGGGGGGEGGVDVLKSGKQTQSKVFSEIQEWNMKVPAR